MLGNREVGFLFMSMWVLAGVRMRGSTGDRENQHQDQGRVRVGV